MRAATCRTPYNRRRTFTTLVMAQGSRLSTSRNRGLIVCSALASFALAVQIVDGPARATAADPAFAEARAVAEAPPPGSRASRLVTLSVVGTNDLHGSIFPRAGRGGLALLGGYLDNLRRARAEDGGGLVLLDAGDTFQGGMESNLTEGAVVVEAYGALGYTAAAIGNHEFDFGSVDAPPPLAVRSGDPRGALKAIAARASYPMLAANLVEEQTGEPVNWPNVRPSMHTTVAGVRVGVVGVMTAAAMRATLAANVHGLRTTPLVDAIRTHATALRGAGAEAVIVVSHAGGRCAQFDAPADLSSCDETSEIFDVVRALPTALVDAVVAGHTHAGVAHVVAGVPIIEAFSGGRAFGRVDLAFDRSTRRVVGATLFPPQDLCAEVDPATNRCDATAERAAPWVPARYEGQVVTPSARVQQAMAPELARVAQMRSASLGVVLDTSLLRQGDLESALGNLFADALRASVPGADAAIANNNAIGGLRADLNAGPLTFGPFYDVFPFDNRAVTIRLSGDALRRVLAGEVARGRRGALGVSGIVVHAGCGNDNRPTVQVTRASGVAIQADETLTVVSTDFLVNGVVLSQAFTSAPVEIPHAAPIVREVVSDWLRARGGRLSASDFTSAHAGRWEQSPTVNQTCVAP